MYISHLQLRNFMCHHELDLDFGSGVNYLVGDNNSGKTTVLRALQYLHDGVTKGHDISEYRYHALGASNEEVDTVPVVVTADIVFERSEVPPQCLADDDPEYNSKADGHLLNDAVYDPLCPYVFFDNNTKQYLLRVRRSSATVTLHKHSKGKASTLGIKDIGVFDNRNKREDEYTNATGISAKIQRLFDPIFVWADDAPDAAADFAPTKIMGKLISEETAKFKESLLWKNFLDAHKKAFITGGDESYMGGDESDMQIDSQPSLQEKLNSIASAIGMRMNEQYGGSNAVQFAFEQPDVSNFVKMGQVLIRETSNDSSNDKDINFGGDITPEAELQHKGTGMQRAFALAAIQVYAEQQREHSVDKSGEDNDGDSEKELPIISSLVALDEPDMALHPCAQYTLADSLHKSQHCQYFISTHSPYMLHGYSDKQDTLHVLYAESRNRKNLISSGKLQIVEGISPSIPAITYFAFGIPTPEFHSELYGRITNVIEETCQKENISVASVGIEIGKDFINIPRKERFDSRKPQKKDCATKEENWNRYGGNVLEEPLPTYVRNCTDHPESIGKMTDEAKQHDEFKNLDNKFSTDELLSSIEIMLEYLELHDPVMVKSGKRFMHHKPSSGPSWRVAALR